MLTLSYGKTFAKELLLCEKRGLDTEKLRVVVQLLLEEQTLPKSYRDHALANSKKFKDARECHIEPDWLLIYKIFNQTLVLKLLHTGTHSDLY